MAIEARGSLHTGSRCRERRSFAPAAFVCAAVLLGSASVGCTSVAAYERGRLAHPSMAPAHASSPAREHVYAVQEGAMGGSGQAASGCGCN